MKIYLSGVLQLMMVGDVNPEVLVQFLLESETEPLLDNYLLAQ